MSNVFERDCKVLSELNRDATSAMSLSVPGIEHTRKGAEPQSCCRRAKARSKCPAICDLAVNFFDQCTADVLSHLIPAWTLVMVGRMHSRTSQAHKTPAISKSFIVTMFLSKSCRRSSGMSIDHTTNFSCPDGNGMIHAPPMPLRQAST